MTGEIHPRRLWRHYETIHAVTYFAEESRAAAAGAGMKGFWMGYFGFRAAPLGAVGPGAVQATFANFAPVLVQRAIPDAWSFADPAALLAARSDSAATALRRLVPGIEEVAAGMIADLGVAASGEDLTGRPLYAANLEVDVPEDPVAALWQHCTSLREHRGDGHISALVAHGMSGVHGHLLQVATGVVPADRLREARGWTEAEWTSASDALIGSGLLAADGSLTDAGRERKQAIEQTTDHLAAGPWVALGDRLVGVEAMLAQLADAIRSSGTIPQPNPIGLS